MPLWFISAFSNVELTINSHFWKRSSMWYFKIQNFCKEILDCSLDLKLKFNRKFCILNVFLFCFVLFLFFSWEKNNKAKSKQRNKQKTLSHWPLRHFQHLSYTGKADKVFDTSLSWTVLGGFFPSSSTHCFFQILFTSERLKNNN